ncbi:DUF6538 domain-containing protein [Candidatus Nitrospira nitrosa]|uniref:DUF6538 domain-containing protein n=1 Tax=Candidatus Nitrospira nitrosa TaxID=1742972 RepID=UPI0038B3E833
MLRSRGRLCLRSSFTKSGSSYTLVSPFPKALRVYFRGRVEVWKSLKTTDKEEASCRASQWIASGTRLFFTLRRLGEASRKRGRHMTKGQIEALVSRWGQ